jgi:hypothetical protein
MNSTPHDRAAGNPVTPEPVARPARSRQLSIAAAVSLRRSQGDQSPFDRGGRLAVWFEDEGFDREIGVDVDLGEEADHFAADGFFDGV